MSLQTRWLVSLSVVMLLASAVSLGLTRAVLYRSADVAADFWLRGAGETALEITSDWTLSELQLVEDAVGADDAWLHAVLARRPSIRYGVRGPDGTPVEGTDCKLVGPLAGGLGPVRCDGEAAIGYEKTLQDGAVLTVARMLDEAFLHEVARHTATEALLVAPDGTARSTLHDVEGRTYVPQLDLDETVEGPQFGQAMLEGAPYDGGHFDIASPSGARRFEIYYFSRPLDWTDHRLVLIIPSSVMLVGTVWTTRIIMVLSALVMTGTLGATMVLLRRLFRPYHELVEATKRVERGDLSVRMTEQGPPELARVATTFNGMVASLGGLARTSRLAGMTEVATGVLHNVGNVLTSVNVSAEVLGSRAARMRTASLLQGARMLLDQERDLGAFLTADPRGRLLPAYLVDAATDLEADRRDFLEEIERLKANIEHMKAVVQMQQSFARTVSNRQPTRVDAVVDDALSMVRASFANHGIRIVCDLEPREPVSMDPVRVAQVLVNLLNNAKDAVRASEAAERIVTLRARLMGDALRIDVSDDGVGIAAGDLQRIFAFGHTTKSDGHGFGLHMSAVAVQEMGGSLTCSSPGPGHGATFHLDLPLSATELAGAVEAA